MKKTEATKNIIIESAIKLLRQKGNATVKEISEDANVNIAAINYHFNDKQSLMKVVIRRVLADLKSRIDNFLSAPYSTEAEIKDGIKNFVDDFYRFSIDNIGIIKYVMIPANKGLLEMANKYFYSMFSLDSEITYKVITRMNSFGAQHSPEDLKVKYIMLFSALALPLLFQLDIKDKRGNSGMFPILNDASLKDKYVEQLTKIILG